MLSLSLNVGEMGSVQMLNVAQVSKSYSFHLLDGTLATQYHIILTVLGVDRWWLQALYLSIW